MNHKKLAIFALHPIIYQTQIFSSLQKIINKKKINLELKVFFENDISLNKVFFDEINTSFKPDTPNLLNGYKYDFISQTTTSMTYISKKIIFFIKSLNAIKMSHSFKPDVILIHGYQSFNSWVVYLYAKFYKIKIIWRGEVVKRKSNTFLKERIKKIILSFYFKNCDAFLFSCSKNMYYLMGYKVPKNKLFFAPSAVDNSYFRNEYSSHKPNKAHYRNIFNISKNDFVILFCSRFTIRKNPYDLIKAAARMSQQSRAFLLFVGDGPEKANMENLCKSLGLRSLFVGFKNQSEISIFYSISDILAITSSYDPSPKVINEAMNFSLPIVASSEIGTIPDLVIHNKNGFVFEAGHLKKLRNYFEVLSSNPKLRNSFGRSSSRIVSDWSHSRNAEAIISSLTFLKILHYK